MPPDLLRDELRELNSFLAAHLQKKRCSDTSYTRSEFRLKLLEICHDIKHKWACVAFSSVSDIQLKRYFTFHLESIRKISDTFLNYSENVEISTVYNDIDKDVDLEISGLINYQLNYFPGFFDYHVIAPVSFQLSFLNELAAYNKMFIQIIENNVDDKGLKECMNYYLDETLDQKAINRLSYHKLFYFKKIVTSIQHNTSQIVLIKLLQRFDFNHLGFFSFLVQKLNERLILLAFGEQEHLLDDENQSELLCIETTYRYDPQWPSLRSMLKGWITERLTAINHQKRNLEITNGCTIKSKLQLDLSVAQLSCFIRLFAVEKIFQDTPLSEIFRFVAENYSSKKQSSISPQSLSKEYYSITQVTAAVMRDLLLRMTSRINHDFFPVLFAVSAVTCFFLKSL